MHTHPSTAFVSDLCSKLTAGLCEWAWEIPTWRKMGKIIIVCDILFWAAGSYT